jgi:hypothetical protein
MCVYVACMGKIRNVDKFCFVGKPVIFRLMLKDNIS